MRRRIVRLLALAGVLSIAPAARSQEAGSGMAEYQKAQLAQSVAVNLARKTQAALQKGHDAEAKKELKNATEMQTLARETAASAVTLEKDRVLQLEAAAADQKKKAEATKDKEALKKAEAAAGEAKKAREKVAAMEKANQRQSETEAQMAKLAGSLSAGSSKDLDGLVKTLAEIDAAMAGAMK